MKLQLLNQDFFVGYFPLGSNFSWKMLTGRLAFVDLTNDSYKNFPNEKVNLVSISSTFFSYERRFGSFFSSYMYVVKAAKTYIRTKNSYV